MTSITRLDQGTINLLDQANFLTIALNAFWVDRKAQDLSFS
jgi:hypothetical protein